MQNIKSIWVLGIGGVGGYFGGRIAYALNDINDGRQIYFIARGQHLQKIQETGLSLQRNDETFICPPALASENMAGFPAPDLCLLCVKSYDLEDAVQSLSKYISDNTIIIPLLNGLDIYQRVRKIMDKGMVLPACVYITSYVEKPGKVVQNGPDGRVVLGWDPQFPSFDPCNLLAFSQEMGLDLNWSPNPYPSIWEKYLLVGSFALVTAASGMSFGEALNDSEGKANLTGIMKEIIELGQKQGIDLKMDLIENTFTFMSRFPYDARSSYQRDLEQGRGKNEGDIFGATIIRMGKELGVPTPITEKMIQRIEDLHPLA
ncbi:MAG: hypothetical protein CVU90_03535 [Firmicutes bacterium HGW-Firmicutes-15]|nr:MAG: hypothetical protein CVU90_03535 [Firmicutes bacterium HGW-Firmicutes-15]